MDRQTPRPIDRTPGMPGCDKNMQKFVCFLKYLFHPGESLGLIIIPSHDFRQLSSSVMIFTSRPTATAAAISVSNNLIKTSKRSFGTHGSSVMFLDKNKNVRCLYVIGRRRVQTRRGQTREGF